MYAVIQTGGKQYRIKSGEQVRVESLPAAVGAAVYFDQVLAVGEGDAVRAEPEDLVEPWVEPERVQLLQHLHRVVFVSEPDQIAHVNTVVAQLPQQVAVGIEDPAQRIGDVAVQQLVVVRQVAPGGDPALEHRDVGGAEAVDLDAIDVRGKAIADALQLLARLDPAPGAGTRFKTELKDVPSQISVMTKEFLEDIATPCPSCGGRRYRAEILEELVELLALRDPAQR